MYNNADKIALSISKIFSKEIDVVSDDGAVLINIKEHHEPEKTAELVRTFLRGNNTTQVSDGVQSGGVWINVHNDRGDVINQIEVL